MSIKDEIIHALGGITYEEHMKRVQDSRDSLDFAAETYERAFRSLNEKVEQYRGVLDILTGKFNRTWEEKGMGKMNKRQRIKAGTLYVCPTCGEHFLHKESKCPFCGQALFYDEEEIETVDRIIFHSLRERFRSPVYNVSVKKDMQVKLITVTVKWEGGIGVKLCWPVDKVPSEDEIIEAVIAEFRKQSCKSFKEGEK